MWRSEWCVRERSERLTSVSSCLTSAASGVWIAERVQKKNARSPKKVLATHMHSA